MKKLIAFVAAACCVFASCVKSELHDSEQTDNLTPSTFTGTLEQMSEPDTKTTLQDGYKVVWSLNDFVMIFNGTTAGSKYKLDPEYVGKDVAKFKIMGTEATGGNSISNIVAYYPHSDGITCAPNGQSYTLNGLVLSATSTYKEGSFPNRANAAVAVAPLGDVNNLKFKNLLGCLRLQIKGNAIISSISLKGNSDEILAGPISVVTNGDTPTVTKLSTSHKGVVLTCPNILLDPDVPKDFYLCVPPTYFASGFNITVTTNDHKTYEFSTSQPCSIKRSVIMRMPVLTCNTPPIDLSQDGTANSYIVSSAGAYKFPTVKGNSSTSVGTIASVSVLWESFGTSTVPSVGDLIKSVSYSNGHITFYTANTFKEGNALIAAKDASGKILWSWHIWLTDKPADQVYYNNAGTMMDRNLGATSATPGDVGALGLMYQWGRKDPFLGSSSISSNTQAVSTLTWPEAVPVDATTGTIAYAQEHPTTFITSNRYPYDWHYGDADNTLWQSNKTIYDPCPPGYRVPDGGDNGVWPKALGSSNKFTNLSLYNSTTKGFNFSTKFGNASTIWYPLAGYLKYSTGQILSVAKHGLCWTVTPYSNYPHHLNLYYEGIVNPNNTDSRGNGFSVRCCKEKSEQLD